jgi:hypothetical protein
MKCLIGEGTKSSDERYHVPSHCIGRCGIGPPFQGCESLRTGCLLRCWPPGSLVDRILYGEACLYQCELIRYQSNHDDYECLNGRVAMSGGDGTYFNIWVPVVSSVWAHVATSDMLNIKWRCFLRIHLQWLYPVLESPQACRGPGTYGAELQDNLQWADRWWNAAYPWQPRWKKGLVRIISDLVLFRLLVPPLQIGVVVLYLVQVDWFLSRLSLEGTGHIQIFRL